MFKYVIFGGGAQGEATAWWLLQQDEETEVILIDRDIRTLAAAAKRINNCRLEIKRLNLPDIGPTAYGLMSWADVAIGATTYEHYLDLTVTAIEAGCSWVDFGGNIAVRKEQAGLHNQAKNAGIIISPDNGIAPGAVSILAQNALEMLGGEADEVRIRVGGLPMENIPPLGYAWAFSADGLIQEMEAPAEILKKGELKTVPSLTGRGFLEFKSPFGELEYAITSDGGGTFADTNQGRVQEFDYATLRYPGHWDFMAAMRDLGFWNPERWVINLEPGRPQVAISAREMTVALLNKNLPRNEPDALVMVVIAKKGKRSFTFSMIAESDPKTGHSAMQRTTGYSGAIVAWMIARGDISKPGVIRLEKDVPARQFMVEWRRWGLNVRGFDFTE